MAALLTAAALVACNNGEEGTERGGPTAPAASTTVTSSPTGNIDLSDGEEIARGIDVPWGLTFIPNGDALIAERDSGRILRLAASGGTPELVFEVPGVSASGEGGLLGLAASPRFATDNLVYAYFTGDQDNRIVRFRLDDASADPEVIFAGIARATIHNGGRIAFGPDGLLYVGTGDAGRSERSQDPASPNGKILRLNPDGSPATGNPNPASPVLTLGHRNVQGLAWDSRGRLFATEFGQNEFDEVNLIEPGGNYGWPNVEGQGDTAGGRFINPLITWRTDEASPSGIAIHGTTAYIAALRGERLWTAPVTNDGLGEPDAALNDLYGRLRTVQIAPDGALWVTTSNTDGRGNVRDGDDRIVRFPAH